MRKGLVHVAGSRGVAAVGMALVALVAGGPVARSDGASLVIKVLSTRADLVAGGEALTQIVLMSGAAPGDVTIDVDGRNVTSSFALRPNGKFEGLVTGLKVGANRLSARLADGTGAQITITNHPIGGPVWTGPQIQPWDCAAGATDAQCDRPATFAYQYKNAITQQFDAYDPSNPPPSFEIATTTTDQGHTVPYIVRQETGDEDRDQYAIAVLFDPSKPWYPWAPQQGWNGKLVYNGGASCGFVHGEGAAPSVIVDAALSRGFAVESTALDNNGHNCNLAVQAESIEMAKEHFVNHYGEIRYTLGNGCSGGSIFQQQDENEYPGLLQGLQPMCSFPDDWSTSVDPVDCNLLLNYFDGVQSQAYTEEQEAAVLGDHTVSVCQSWVNVYQYSQGGNPSQTNTTITPCLDSSQSSQEYNASSNIGGVRCTLQDYMVNVLGRRTSDLWTANEKKLGHGFANSPYDNVGVQYGLAALMKGTISTAQFVDINSRVGGYDIDYNPIPGRTTGTGIANAYRAGLINEGDGLADVGMIDLRGHDETEIHSDFRSYVMRARLAKANGGHGNQIVWTGPAPLVGDSKFTTESLVLLDQWLSAVVTDSSPISTSAKVLKDRPAGAVDECFDGNGDAVSSASVCQAAFPYYADPRIASGAPLTDDIIKCQLKPMTRSDYGSVSFTDSEWADLQKVFPGGVCDWTKPGQFQDVKSVKWATFAGGPGGEAMAAAPVSQVLGASSTGGATTLPNTGTGNALIATGFTGLLVLVGLGRLVFLIARRAPRN